MEMTASLFLLFNHRLTPDQEKDAVTSLGIRGIVGLPSDIGELWRQIPPELSELSGYLKPIMAWLSSEAAERDYVLIQGDFGACFLMVKFAFEKGLIPVYATTKREAVEEHQPDGSVKMTHRFQHYQFRKYGD